MGANVLLFCLIGFAWIDAGSVRLLPFEREAYGAVLGIFGLIAVLSLKRISLRPLAAIFTISWVTLSFIALIQGLWGHGWELSYLFGDFSVLMIPVLLFIAGNAGYPSIFADRKALDAIGYGLIVAAGISFFFGRDVNLAGRYDPPNLFLAAWLMAKVLSAITVRKAQGYSGLLMMFGAVAFLSNERTTVMIWACGVVVLLLSMRGKQIAQLALPMVVLGLVGITSHFISTSVDDGGFQSRFSKIEAGNDESLQGRYNEVSDMFSTIDREWGPIDYIVGAGHGATFLPELSFPPRNVIGGRVHNIHIGPALMFYRYGLMGIVGWLWWLIALVASVRRAMSRDCPEVDRVIILSAGFVFLDSLMRNPFIDPISCFSVAGLFHLFLGVNRARPMSFSGGSLEEGSLERSQASTP
jgi:hypothetical protein